MRAKFKRDLHDDHDIEQIFSYYQNGQNLELLSRLHAAYFIDSEEIRTCWRSEKQMIGAATETSRFVVRRAPSNDSKTQAKISSSTETRTLNWQLLQAFGMVKSSSERQ
jgi:hypothetical protein